MMYCRLCKACGQRGGSTHGLGERTTGMRIITGTARGRRLITPEGLDVRPTSEKVKEAVFSVIQFEIEGRRILDMFAGSGQLGIEALSRGAASAVFLDAARPSSEIVKKNLELTGLSANARVYTTDAFSFASTCGSVFDIAFLDPPYRNELCVKALAAAAPLMSESGVMICETEVNESLPDAAGDFLKQKSYKYGKTRITVYRKET